MVKNQKFKWFLLWVLSLIILLFFTFSFAQNLYVEEGQVYVCPLATKTEEINPKCECRVDLILGETVRSICGTSTYEMTLTIQEYDGQQYYAIYGFENGGAGVNLPPQAKISGSFEGFVNEKISFSGLNSFDPNADPLDFLWDFGDGILSKEKEVSHIYSTSGEYLLKLTVADGLASSTATATIIIKSKPSTEIENLSFSQATNNPEKSVEEIDQNRLSEEAKKTKTLFPKIVKGVQEEKNKLNNNFLAEEPGNTKNELESEKALNESERKSKKLIIPKKGIFVLIIFFSFIVLLKIKKFSLKKEKKN